MAIKYAWRAYCERCEWRGPIRLSNVPGMFSEANLQSRRDLGLHYGISKHELDTAHADGDNIHSVGVELLQAGPRK